MADFDNISRQFEKMLELGSATVCEAQDSRGVIEGGITSIDSSMKMAGPAVTVDMAPGDNLMIHRALLETKPGDILVIDCKGYLSAGVWGDVLTEQAVVNKLAGVIVNGAVRDTQPIKDMKFPVFAKGICIKGTNKIAPGQINTPVCIGGVQICPGDIILGDSDGIVAVKPDELDDVLKKAVEREEKENNIREQIRRGGQTIDLLGLRNPMGD